jgi:hypothetical protein
MYPFIHEPRISLKLRYYIVYPTSTLAKPSLPPIVQRQMSLQRSSKDLEVGKYFVPLSLIPGAGISILERVGQLL